MYFKYNIYEVFDQMRVGGYYAEICPVKYRDNGVQVITKTYKHRASARREAIRICSVLGIEIEQSAKKKGE
jgi:hypothetical protein